MPIERAYEAILEDLRGRRLLKWLFKADADTNDHPIGYVDGPIDLATQKEVAIALTRAVLMAIREPSESQVRAFVDLALHSDVLSHGGWPGYARDQWRAMIDAALAETESSVSTPTAD